MEESPSARAPRPRILCVDDEAAVLDGLSLVLGRHFEVVVATKAADGLEVLEQQGPFDVVLSDMRMPFMDGATFLRIARERAPETTRILLTGQSDFERAISAVNEGRIFRYLMKPCPPKELLSVIEDAVSEHRREVKRARALEILSRDVAAAERLQDEFLSNVSHELKTPLAAIMGSSELLRMQAVGPLTDEQQEIVTVLEQRTSDLLGLIETTLHAGQLNMGARIVRLVETPLDDIVVALRMSCSSIPPQSIQFRTDLPQRCDGSLVTDCAKLVLIVRTLLNNAFKFTRQGAVDLTFRAEPAGVTIGVADTGPGIPAEDLPHVFDRFRQGDGSVTREHGGLGLGLFVARELARQLGGDLSVRSQAGSGSVFQLHLPRRSEVGR